MNQNIARATWESACTLASEFITKKRYAMGVGLVIGFLAGYPI